MIVIDGVSKLGYTSVIFVDLGVKVDGTYYCDFLLSKQSRHVSSEFFISENSHCPMI